MLVQEFLENSADRLPNKVGLICDDQRLSYGEIEARANRLANALIALGINRGDRVALFLPNGVELVVGVFAILKAGGVFVVINSTTKKNKLQFILNNCTARALITPAQQAEDFQDMMERIPSLHGFILTGEKIEKGAVRYVSWYQEIQTTGSTSRPAKVSIDLDLACLVYTSGSTGDPKGVMSDHSNVEFVSGSIIQYIGNREDDVVINVLPLSFDYGLYQLLMVFRFGGTLVLDKGFAFPAAILKLMEKERVTGFPGVPTIYTRLIQMDLSKYDLSSLRYMTNTAAALPPNHILQIREKFPWVTLFSMYGLTETKRTLYLPPDQLEKRPDSVGIAIPGTEVWLEDEEGNRLAPGQVGELVVRGRHVMRGYWNDPEMTAMRYHPGMIPGERLCYSGDLFRIDEEGYLYFVARKDDMIKSRGEKVSPVEIERVLYELDGVIEAAVIGVPDPLLGQAIKAFIVTSKEELNRRMVVAHCRSRLEDFMIPQQVEFVHELPKTSSGKINKSDLK